MGAENMMNSGDFDANQARYNRMNRTQPAEYAPGQDAVYQDNSVYAKSSVPNDGGAMGISDQFNPFSPGVASPGAPSQNSMTAAQGVSAGKDASDVFWGVVGKAAKGSMNFIKQLMTSVKFLNARWYAEWGRTSAITGLVVAGIGILLRIFGVGIGLQFTVGGFIATGIGAFTWIWKTDDAAKFSSKYSDGSDITQNFSNPPSPVENATDFGGGMDFDGDFGDSDGYDCGEEEDGGTESDEEDIYDGVTVSKEPSPGMSPDDALASMPEIPKGMYERQYLYNMFTKVLPTMRPDFASLRTINEDDDVFLAWDEKLQQAAEIAGCKEDNMPELLSLQENLFTVIVTCSRPVGMKADVVANELASIYAFNGGERNQNVFAKVDTVGLQCQITIFNGAGAMISLKDMMLQDSKWILDNKNYLPVILGIGQRGNVVHADFKSLESIIITGMPRSGKSWFVQAVLTQLCAFCSPKELNIYICDPKEGISDFKAFVLPHVKKFVSGDGNIVKTLRDLVKTEAPRRKKIIGDAGFVNIWDYKERYPDVQLPIIYVVVDEVVTLASRMDKDTNNEFRMLLRELISQLPALGIRAFLIPHVLNNDIIEKKTSDLVPCKVSVCGDADHIEKATGSKPKDFPYKLANKGDMAVKLTGHPDTIYVHGPALTDSNPKNNELFNYLRRAWNKLEPDEDEGGKSVEPMQSEIKVGNTGQVSGLSFDDIAGDDEDFNIF